MKVFVTRTAWKDARRAKIKKEFFVKAAKRTNDGLVDAHIGAHLFKQHMGRKGDYRLILFLIKDGRAVVLHMYPKNQQANITDGELKTLQELADKLAVLSEDDYLKLARTRGWEELSDDDAEEDV